MLQLSKELEKYLVDFGAFSNNGASKAPAWLKDLRTNAIGKFKEMGFPTVKQEDWRFTNILPLTKIPFRHASMDDVPEVRREQIAKFILGSADKSHLVFVNGHYSEKLSDLSALTGGIVSGSLREFVEKKSETVRQYLNRDIPMQNHPFAALNAAFIHDGAYIHVREGEHVTPPVQLLFVSVPPEGSHIVTHPRNLIVVDGNASVTILESYVTLSETEYFTNSVSEVFVANGAAVDYAKVQHESEKAFHVGTIQAAQKARSRFTAFSLALGGAIARNDMNITIDGDHCETMLDGLYIPANEQLIDHHTFIDHRKPDCSSREIFKGIVTGNSRSVFNGKIFVRREAQKTDSKQTNKNLLLSETATVDTKPQLEIFADDVKCTHGATVGGLDDASLFYVKSRGISQEAARALLTVGFASEVTNYINDETLRKHVDALVIERLQEKVVQTPLPEIVHSEIKTV